MAKHVGDNWSLTVNSTSIANLLSISPSGSFDTADTTDADSSGWVEHLRTNRDFSLDVEAHYDPTDSGYQAVRDDFMNDNDSNFTLTESDGTNTETWSGTGSITDFSKDETHDDKVTYSFTLEASGSVSQS